MNDPRIRKWAEVMTQYSAPVQPGYEVLIRGTALAEPLILELARAILERDAIPHVHMTPPQLQELFFRHASDQVLNTLPDLTRMMTERMDVYFLILSEGNTRALTNVDPVKTKRLQRTRGPLTELILNREAAGDLQWCVTLFPTPAYAQDAEMGWLEYTDFVFEACFLNEADPVARWQQLADRQQRLIEFLEARREVHVKAPGTDLRVGIGGRKWVNDRGDDNLPAGEVFTGPVENEVNGHVTFTFPVVHEGREVRGIQLWFEVGQVVKATATNNEEFLLEMLDTDEGARYLGEFAFGTNYRIQRFMRNTLFDEKIGGTMHMALGLSVPATGGRNTSAIHWDLVSDLRQEGEVYVDGELFQRNGRFMLLEEGIV
jgi:aminopeptidase